LKLPFNLIFWINQKTSFIDNFDNQIYNLSLAATDVDIDLDCFEGWGDLENHDAHIYMGGWVSFVMWVGLVFVVMCSVSFVMWVGWVFVVMCSVSFVMWIGWVFVVMCSVSFVMCIGWVFVVMCSVSFVMWVFVVMCSVS